MKFIDFPKNTHGAEEYGFDTLAPNSTFTTLKTGVYYLALEHFKSWVQSSVPTYLNLLFPLYMWLLYYNILKRL